MWVFINYIQRNSNKIDDGQPELISIDWKREIELEPSEWYNFYCNLETGVPILIKHNDEVLRKYFSINTHIFIPNYSPQTETYHYNNHSLEKITKGSATFPFNRLQLYYFRLLLENSCEDAIKRIKSLSLKEKEEIYCSK